MGQHCVSEYLSVCVCVTLCYFAEEVASLFVLWDFVCCCWGVGGADRGLSWVSRGSWCRARRAG